MMDARRAAAALGGKAIGRNKVKAPGPGHSRQDGSLLVTLDPGAPEGFTVHSFAGDDWRECRDYVRRRLGLPEWQPGDERDRRVPTAQVKNWDADMMEEEMGPRSDDDLLRIKRARQLWDEAGDPRGTLAETYLREYRKLNLSDELAGSVLRFHSRTPWRDENTGKTIRLPALIAAFRSIDDNEITAVHRIALNADGSKIDRRMLGVVQRAAVKLDPAPADGVLVIGEGVETCMAARQLDLRPAWALGSVGAISFFPVISGIRRLAILGEAGEASKEATKLCAKRWRRIGCRVQIIYSEIGNDINDAVIAGARNG